MMCQKGTHKLGCRLPLPQRRQVMVHDAQSDECQRLLVAVKHVEAGGWVLDSGASHHITNDASTMSDMRPLDDDIHITFFFFLQVAFVYRHSRISTPSRTERSPCRHPPRQPRRRRTG